MIQEKVTILEGSLVKMKDSSRLMMETCNKQMGRRLLSRL